MSVNSDNKISSEVQQAGYILESTGARSAGRRPLFEERTSRAIKRIKSNIVLTFRNCWSFEKSVIFIHSEMAAGLLCYASFSIV
jgi:hypothetical protein